MAVVADSQHLPAVVIALPAEIDMANAGRVAATRFCDSSGISVLVRAHKQAVASRTELRLVVPSGAVLRALTLVRMDDVLPIYPSLSQALAAGPAPGPRARQE